MATRDGTPRLLRSLNDRAALDLLLELGPLSRGQLGELTGLSKPTASQLLARLEDAGLVVHGGRSSGRPGPGAQLYEINPTAAYVAALDVTPTRIRSAVADILSVLQDNAFDNVGHILAGISCFFEELVEFLPLDQPDSIG